ncbi:RNA polymerase sigma factor SigX [Halobacillus rhizosphaerae]|uniref:RNA polymerase sigma factor SigX n=1 Tax=Halobacillus rhizosphaerae TaxID=3064889 RepID=UPI00398A9008
MNPVFERIYEQYHQDLYQFIMYMVKDRDIAEDLVQETYIKILRSYHTYDNRSSEKTWLFSIARHVTIDYFRKQKRKRARIFDWFDWGEKQETIQDHQPLPEELAIQNDELREVYQTLDQCTVDQKTVIILRYIQGMSIKETASILGFSESKIKTTQHRAIKAIKDKLENKVEGGVQHDS